MLGNLLMLVILGGVGAFVVWYGRLLLKVSQAEKALDAEIAARGVDAEAEIVNHRMTVGSRGSSYYYITYQFTPTGQTQAITQETAVSGSNYHQLSVGSHISIRYLPDNPKSVSLGPDIRETFGAASMKTSGTAVIVIGVVMIMFGLVFFVGLTVNDTKRAATATAITISQSATPDVAQMRATVAVASATALADQAMAAKLSDALASRIPDWKQVTDHVMHRVLPPETDLHMYEVEFDYGYCANNSFYLYIWTRITDRIRIGDEIDTFLEGYGYVEPSTPLDCYPKELSQVWLRDTGSLGNNWYAVSGAIDVKPTPQN